MKEPQEEPNLVCYELHPSPQDYGEMKKRIYRKFNPRKGEDTVPAKIESTFAAIYRAIDTQPNPLGISFLGVIAHFCKAANLTVMMWRQDEVAVSLV